MRAHPSIMLRVGEGEAEEERDKLGEKFAAPLSLIKNFPGLLKEGR